VNNGNNRLDSNKTTNTKGLLGRGFDFAEGDRVMGFWVYPDEGVVPTVRKFDFDEVVAPGAPRPTGFEDGVGTYAVTRSAFQHELSALVLGNSRWAACFTEGFHFPRFQVSEPMPNTPERWVKLLPVSLLAFLGKTVPA